MFISVAALVCMICFIVVTGATLYTLNTSEPVNNSQWFAFRANMICGSVLMVGFGVFSVLFLQLCN